MLAHLLNQPQLIDAFRLRATVAHGALHNCIGSNPTQSRAEHMAQVVDLEIRDAGPLECSPPSLPYVSDRLVGIAWTRKEKWASLSLLVFPFAKDLARKKRKGTYPNVKFDFLGYCFRPRLVKRFRDNTLFCGFNPAVSSSAMKAMRSTIRELKLHHQTQLSLQDIARQLNPLLRGWIEYYGRYASSALYPLLRHINQMLVAWVMRKFKRFKGHTVRASQFLQRLAKEQRALFVHWDIGMTGVLN